MNPVVWFAARPMPVAEVTEATDRLTIEALVQRHTAFVWRVLRRLGLSPADADDGVQQVFMVAARNLARIHSENDRAFLYGTAVNIANNTRRSHRRQRALTQAQAAEVEEHHPGPDEALAFRDACDRLDKLLADFPDEQRRVLVLVEIEQLELAEVAQLEGIRRGTAASRLRLARQRLGELLKKAPEQNPFGRPNE